MPAINWRPIAGPAAVLVAATIIAIVAHSALNGGSTPQTTTTSGSPPHRSVSSPRLYTVKAGDTFAGIASTTGVSVAKLSRLNPNVSTTALFIGEHIKLR